MDCNSCKTEKDYLIHGLPFYLGFYLGTGMIMLAMSVFNQSLTGQYWKFVLLFAVACLEGILLVTASDPLQPFLLSHKTTAERISLLRHLMLACYMVISQLGPMYFPRPDEKSLRRLLIEMDHVVQMEDKEAHLSFKNAFEPFHQESNLLTLLQRKMEKLAVDTRIESDVTLMKKKK